MRNAFWYCIRRDENLPSIDKLDSCTPVLSLFSLEVQGCRIFNIGSQLVLYSTASFADFSSSLSVNPNAVHTAHPVEREGERGIDSLSHFCLPSSFFIREHSFKVLSRRQPLVLSSGISLHLGCWCFCCCYFFIFLFFSFRFLLIFFSHSLLLCF
jgi:hypothetical protein